MLSSILHGVFLFSPFEQALESRINACCYHTNCYEYSHIDSTANRIREMQLKGARLILGATIVDDILINCSTVTSNDYCSEQEQ